MDAREPRLDLEPKNGSNTDEDDGEGGSGGMMQVKSRLSELHHRDAIGSARE